MGAVSTPLAVLATTVLGATMLATQALEEAIERGVREARGRAGVPGLADK